MGPAVGGGVGQSAEKRLRARSPGAEKTLEGMRIQRRRRFGGAESAELMKGDGQKWTRYRLRAFGKLWLLGSVWIYCRDVE